MDALYNLVNPLTGRNGHVHVFPYSMSDLTGPPQTQELVVQHAQEAYKCKSAVMGVKGPSWLSSLMYFNLVRGSIIDYMHTVLLGVCRVLLYLWFDHSEAWYIGNRQEVVNSRLIKPPS